MMKKIYLLIFFSAFFMPFQSHAEKVALRGSFSLGGFAGKFKQSAFGKTADYSISPAPAMQAGAGLEIFGFFVKYNPFWFDAFNNARDDDSAYWSITSFEAGYSFSFIPIDIYGGGGWSHFSVGGETHEGYSGPGFKGGLRALYGGIGIQAEYHRLLAREDDLGSLPEEEEVGANLYYLGIVFSMSPGI